MGRELDLLARYPKAKRNLTDRFASKTEETRQIARQFGYEYFDGDRNYGYGGFAYHSRFWSDVVEDIIEQYGLTANSSVLDVGCAKGFFIYDLHRAIPGINVLGVDVSKYALDNAHPDVRGRLILGNAKELPFASNAFDLVISINTIHNLEKKDCGKALAEINRVSKGKSFITVDAYRNFEEKERMEQWNLTALTMMSDTEWKIFFQESGYKGDYFWFIP